MSKMLNIVDITPEDKLKVIDSPLEYIESQSSHIFLQEFLAVFNEYKEKYPESETEIQIIKRVLTSCVLFLPRQEIQDGFKPLVHSSISKEQRKKENFSPENSSRRRISAKASRILNTWLEEHMEDPYPTMEDKLVLAQKAELTVKQVKTWFTNQRARSSLTKNVGHSNIKYAN
eukprot:TRINITY_DN4062_c0_g1_i2.p1 TRINITY_DN4062_c0_g1~~TRINITY_DN4062_c0_g1_i2.p1  ORF type:complete len:174 (+),score=12.72 TRINITY_DN4062_c0_g1_i2:120-641(+)